MYGKYIIALLSFAALFGCQKDSDHGEIIDDGDAVVFSGSSTADGASRTSLGDTSLAAIPVYWSPSDAIGIYASSPGTEADNARATITDGAGTQNGRFVSLGVTMAETDNVFCIYYPYSKGAGAAGAPDADNPIRFAGGDDPSLTIFLSSEQRQQVAGVYDQFGKYGFSVARSAPVNKGGEVRFSMKHVLSYLELSLWSTAAELEGYKVEQIDISVSDDKYLTGTFKTDFDGNFEQMAGSESDKKLILSVSRPAELVTGKTEAQRFLATILPTDLTGAKLTIAVVLSREAGGSTRTITATKSFDGADFSGGILMKVDEDISKWEVPLPMPAAMETFLAKIGDLEYWATKWYTDTKPVTATQEANSYSGKYPQWLIASHMRQYGGYSGGTWTVAGGDIKNDFTAYLQSSDVETFNYIKNVASLPGLADGAYPAFGFATRTIDVRHMMATMSAVIYGVGGTLDDLSGWGGDLVTLVINMLKHRDTSAGAGDEAFYAALTRQWLARPGTTYDMDDLIGDVDAVNIPAIIKAQDTDMHSAMSYYYSSALGHRRRFSRFLDYFGANETAFYNKTLEYTAGSNLMIRILYSSNGFDPKTLTAAQSKGIARGYCDFILSLAAAE